MPRSVSALHAAARARPLGLARSLGQAAYRALGSRRSRTPANRGTDPRLACFGPTILLGKVATPATAAQSPPNLGQNSSLGVGADREACRLFLSCHTAPLEAFLCDRDAAAGSQPPSPDAAAGSQRHPHDLAVCAGYPAGFAARIPPGPPECWPLTSAARACVPQRYPERRSPRYLSGIGGNTSSSGNVPPPVRQ